MGVGVRSYGTRGEFQIPGWGPVPQDAVGWTNTRDCLVAVSPGVW